MQIVPVTLNCGRRWSKLALPVKLAVAMGLHIYYNVYCDEGMNLVLELSYKVNWHHFLKSCIPMVTATLSQATTWIFSRKNAKSCLRCVIIIQKIPCWSGFLRSTLSYHLFFHHCPINCRAWQVKKLFWLDDFSKFFEKKCRSCQWRAPAAGAATL